MIITPTQLNIGLNNEGTNEDGWWNLQDGYGKK